MKKKFYINNYMNKNYQEKYLKYKNKYLKLCREQKGGNLLTINLSTIYSDEAGITEYLSNLGLENNVEVGMYNLISYEKVFKVFQSKSEVIRRLDEILNNSNNKITGITLKPIFKIGDQNILLLRISLKTGEKEILAITNKNIKSVTFEKQKQNLIETINQNKI